jgi:hypothetical protein
MKGKLSVDEYMNWMYDNLDVVLYPEILLGVKFNFPGRCTAPCLTTILRALEAIRWYDGRHRDFPRPQGVVKRLLDNICAELPTPATVSATGANLSAHAPARCRMLATPCAASATSG